MTTRAARRRCTDGGVHCFGYSCLGLNGGPEFRHSEAFSFQIATDSQEETGPLLERDRRQWRQGRPVRLVQGSLGPLLADHSARADRGACGWWQ